MRGKPRVLVVGHFGQKNAGDDAMLLGILKGLHERFPAAQVRVLSTSRNPDFVYNLPIERNVEYSARSVFSVLRSLIWAHLVVLGGGTHFHDFHGHKRYVKNLVLFGVFFTLARLLGKKVAFIGIGVGPLDTWWGKWLARRTLPLANLIIVREHCSLQLVKKLIPQKKGLLLGVDPAVLLTDSVNKTNNRIPTSIKILGCSILPYYAIYENRPQRDGVLIHALAEAIRHWLEEDKDREVHIIVFRGPSKEDDFKISRELADKISQPGRVSIVSYDPDPIKMLQEMEKCDALIAMRFHSIVFSYLSQRPCIVLSYHPKCEAIASEMEIPRNAVLWLDEASNADHMIEKLHHLTKHPEEFVAQLPISKGIEKAERMYDELKKLLGQERGGHC